MIDSTLLEEAKCYLCLGVSLSEALKMALLARIAAGGGGGGGAQTPWTSDIDGGCFNLNNVCMFNGIRVYRALLTQSGTDAPIATVLENTVGNIIWTRDSQGAYFGTLNGTFIQAQTFYLTLPATDPLFVVTFNRASDDQMFIATTDSGVAADGVLQSTPFEILIYPATPQCPDCAT